MRNDILTGPSIKLSTVCDPSTFRARALAPPPVADHGGPMATNGALALIADAGLRDEIERIAAAAGIRVVYAATPSGRRAWVGAAAVLLDVAAAQRCRELGMPRRSGVLLLVGEAPGTPEFEAAMTIGP